VRGLIDKERARTNEGREKRSEERRRGGEEKRGREERRRGRRGGGEAFIVLEGASCGPCQREFRESVSEVGGR